jgi:hypothetical protein
MFSGSVAPNLFYLRIGQFIPEMVTFASNHRGLTLTSYAFNTYSPVIGDEFVGGHQHGAGGHDDELAEEFVGPEFGIEMFQLGVELSGLVKKRFRYVLGLVNGTGTSGENNAAKDGYFRLGYKFGGMAYDGSGGSSDTNKNWAEKSLALGVFGYRGFAVNEGGFGPKDLEIGRIGFDVNWYWNDLNLYGGYLWGHDENLLDQAVSNVDFNMFFAEADYVIYPWMIGVLRYEQANPDGMDTIRRLIPNLTLLYRANIKFVLETRFDPSDIDIDIFQIGLDFAY